MKILSSSWAKTTESYFPVLKEINKYFAGYFIFASLLFLLVLSFSPSFQDSTASFSMGLVISGLLLLAKAFIVFMIPYYAYKHSKGTVPPFWTFIKETIWSVLIAHIKAALMILLFFFLLIIPAIYKAVRYTFITETVLFDKFYKENPLSSVLKTADNITRAYFWSTALLVFLTILFPALLNALINQIPLLPLFIKSSLSLIVAFYVSCFVTLLRCQFYFELKEQKGEEISC